MSFTLSRLESRVHLTRVAAPVAVLPSGITAVGDSVYFVQSGVTRLNTKTGVRGSIVHADGTPFGKYPTTLSAAPGRLIITEQVGRRSDFPPYNDDLFDIWSVADGSNKATRLLSGSQQSLPRDIASAGGVTYFSVTSPINGSDFYAFDASHPAAYRAIDPKAAGNGDTILFDAVPWGARRLALQLSGSNGTHFYSYDIKKRTFTQVGAAGLPAVKNGWNFASLHVVGDGLALHASQYGDYFYKSRVYTLAGTSTTWQQFTPIAGSESTNLLGVAGGRAIVIAKDNDTSTIQKLVYTDFTTAGTLNLEVAKDPSNRPDFVENDANYFVHNNALYASTALGVSTLGNNELVKWDLPSGSRTTLARSGDIGEFTAGSFAFTKKLVYFRRSFYSPKKGTPIAELWQTDGTTGGTVRVSAANAGPVVAGGYILYTAKPTATTLSTPPAPLVGGIEGRIVRDDARVSDLSTLETGMQGFEVYVDRNNNRKHDAGEARATTDIDGYYALHNLAAGTYRIRIEETMKFTPTHGSAPRLTVVAGKGTRFDFGLADDIRGQVAGKAYTPGNYALNFQSIWVDLNRNGKRDSGEPRSDVYNGDFDFGTGLRASTGLDTYRVGVYQNKTYFFELFVPAGGSTTIRLDALTA